MAGALPPYEPERLYFFGGWIPQPRFVVRDPMCGGAFVEYHGLVVPVVGDLQAPHVQAGLIRHTDGRRVYMGEPMICDTCHKEPVIGTNMGDPTRFALHPANFKRVA